MKKIIAFIIFLCIVKSSVCQNISFQLPYYAGKSIALYQFTAGRKQLIDSIILDDKGAGVINTEYFTHTGMAQVVVSNTGFNLFVSAKEKILVKSANAPLTYDGLQILQSKENTVFSTWLNRQSSLMGRGAELGKIIAQQPANPALAQQLHAVEDSIRLNNVFLEQYNYLYSVKYIKQRNLLQYCEQIYNSNNIYVRDTVRKAFLQQYDIETLNYSDFWKDGLNPLADLYKKGALLHDSFAVDIIQKLKAQQDYAAFSGFAYAALNMCLQFYWDDQQDKISDFLKQPGKVSPADASLLRMIRSNDLKVGKKAPDIIVPAGAATKGIFSAGKVSMDKLNTDYTLLLFYESDCEHCLALLKDFIPYYPSMLSKKIKVASLASDTDRKLFENKLKEFPWVDTYCDFRGQLGENFSNYGVLATPTIYVLDKNGYIILKPVDMKEIKKWVESIN